ncbi:hypothetical protein NEMIN01_2396, partial [Nematocida minor]|uniref:uncharacterized protein n=1 Tax=Nematocida minor TaxID=1912983 RepID=UPI00221F4F64
MEETEQPTQLKKTYSYIVRESIYFRRALLLQPLTTPGCEKRYTPTGMAFNIFSLFVSMVVSSSCYKTLFSFSQPKLLPVYKFVIYICIGRMIPLFSFVMCLGTIIYLCLFSFTLLESGYIITYSLSTTFPIALIGKSMQLYFTSHIEIIGALIFLINGVVSTIFILANRSK